MKTSVRIAIAGLAGVSLLAAFGQSVDAAVTPAASGPDLPRFRFRPTPGNERDTDVERQASSQACRDILVALNSRSSNRLFSPDGTLVSETQYVRTLHWEPLDKDRYAAGFAALLATKSPKVQLDFQQRFESNEWRLARAPAIAERSPPSMKASDIWLYRLEQTRPRQIAQALPGAQQQLDESFPTGTHEWVGDAVGAPHPEHRYRVFTGRHQWVARREETYALDPAHYDDAGGRRSHFLVTAAKLISVNSSVGRTSILREACVFEVSTRKPI